ncbi:MAG: Omp28-related outer membrane protein [Prevotella sp.]
MIKSLIASIVLLCLPGMAAHGEEQQIQVSLGVIKSAQYKQVTTAATTGAATLLGEALMQPLKGNAITQVSVDLNAGATELVVFFKHHINDATSILEQKVVPTSAGWNTVTLDTPLNITGDALVMGYRTTGVRFLRYGARLLDGQEWLMKGEDKWEVMSDASSASIYATVSGESLPKHNVVVTHAVMPAYTRTNNFWNSSIEVLNLGTEDATSLEVTLWNGDKKMGADTFDCGKIPYRTRATVPLYFYMSEDEGTYPCKMEVTNINGQTDVYAADNSSRLQNLTLVNNWTDRKVLLEVFSTERCTGCPGGHEYINWIFKNNSDVVEVGHHSGFYTDQFTLPESITMEWFYKPSFLYAPAVMFDRTCDALNYPKVYEDNVPVTDLSDLTTPFKNCLNTPAFVDISMDKTYDDATRQLTLNIGTETLLATETPDSLRLTVMLTEDSVATESQAGVAGTYYHRHLLRKYLTPVWGSSMQASTTFTITLPEDWNVQKMQAVAFVANYNAKDKNDCRVMNTQAVEIANASTGIKGVKGNGEEHSSTQSQTVCVTQGKLYLPQDCSHLTVYDMNGRCVHTLDANRPSVSIVPGMYVLKRR